MTTSVLLRISGTVQGVFFRASTKKKAEELGITGWVQNCSDGTVEIEAHGSDAAMQEFIDWCHIGPEMASVENITVVENYNSPADCFEIR